MVNNRDLNIAESNHDYDCCHNRAALVITITDSHVALNKAKRSVARFGPRQIRAESVLLRNYSGTGVAPWESMMVADIGDVNVNLYNLKDACKRIREAYRKVVATGCVPLTLGEFHPH